MDITLANCSIMTVVAVFLSIGGMLLVRRNVSLDDLRKHHDVTDPLLAVLGTLFAILLGFMLANSMQRFEDARSNSQTEAAAIGAIYRISDGLPTASKMKTRKDCLTYLDQVIDDEWPHMSDGKMSARAASGIDNLWHDCVRYDPQTQGQATIHQALVEAMSTAGSCRRVRAAQLCYSLPAPLWVIVIFGGLSTICFTYFFAVDNVKLHMLMTSVITMIICLNIYMLAGFDAPFSGDIAITPAAFVTTRDLSLSISQREDYSAKTAPPQTQSVDRN